MDHNLYEIEGMKNWQILDNNDNREITLEQCMTLFKRDPKESLHCFVTVDEKLIHWYQRPRNS